LSMIANDVLLEVAEPERIVAFSRHGVDNARTPYRFSGKSTLTSLRDVEAVLALNPDLVLIHNLSGPGPAERLREAGIAVFDLGHMRGRATLVEDTLQIAALMGDPARGERVIRPWLRRMDRVASGVDRSKAPTALYVSLYAGRMFGGAAQTSYHDVLEAAGVVDAAAEHGFEGWPNYNAEQLVTINPDVIITPEGMAKRLCAQPGLDILQACVRGQVLEFNGSMLSDPGLGMLEASEAIHTRIYSEQKGDRQPQLDAPGVKEQPERPTEEASP
ncbi:MAG: ABC transporter substrate-binding protein, partial [Myxococcota bacterium]